MINSAPLLITRKGAPAGSEVVPCDMVIRAVGQYQLPGFDIPEDHPKVYMGGDFANGGAEIVNAAAEGMEAARRIDGMLRGNKGDGSGERGEG